jgi:hypothetical protein
MGDAERGDQQHEQEKKYAASVHPPIVQEEDEGEKDIQYGYMECQTLDVA